MTEIKLEVKDPRALARMLRQMIPVNSDDINPDERPTIEGICAQIEEQLPKPAIDEPEEFGSVVRAISGLSVSGTLWQMAPGHGAHYWEDEHGCVEVWSELTDVEVLRVGVGGGDYTQGVREANSQACDRLRLLLSEAITSERKNALEKAIQAVEELAP